MVGVMAGGRGEEVAGVEAMEMEVTEGIRLHTCRKLRRQVCT